MKPQRRTFERTLRARAREVCLADPALNLLYLRSIRAKFWRKIFDQGFVNLLLSFLPIFLLLLVFEFGRDVLVRRQAEVLEPLVTLWLLVCFSGLLLAVSIIGAVEGGAFSRFGSGGFFLPQEDEVLLRRWRARWWRKRACVGAILCGVMYGMLMTYNRLPVFASVAACGLVLLQALVVPAAAVFINRILPREDGGFWWPVTGVAVFVTCVIAALAVRWLGQGMPIFGFLLLAALPTGWVNLAFQQALVQQQWQGWLWLLPAVGLIVVARRYERAPLGLREFAFASEGCAVPVCAPDSPWCFSCPATLTNSAVRSREPENSCTPGPATPVHLRPTPASLRKSMELPRYAEMPRSTRWFACTLNDYDRLIFRILAGAKLSYFRYAWWISLATYGAFLGILLVAAGEEVFRLRPWWAFALILPGFYSQMVFWVLRHLWWSRERKERSAVRGILNVPIPAAAVNRIGTRLCLTPLVATLPLSLTIVGWVAWSRHWPLSETVFVALPVVVIPVFVAVTMGGMCSWGTPRPWRQRVAKACVEMSAVALAVGLSLAAVNQASTATVVAMALLALLGLGLMAFKRWIARRWEMDYGN